MDVDVGATGLVVLNFIQDAANLQALFLNESGNIKHAETVATLFASILNEEIPKLQGIDHEFQFYLFIYIY